MLKTLQEATHKIRTAFGVSKKGFGPVRPPLGGIGQGNGAGPTIWACIREQRGQMAWWWLSLQARGLDIAVDPSSGIDLDTITPPTNPVTT